ncbi:MAG TPA: transposase [Firmicutes bacterium]|nr:transposase [Bacillota bacterium]
MKFNPECPHRRSIRLHGYDYSLPGAYFITICVQNGKCLFRKIQDAKMHLNEPGRMIKNIWDELPIHYDGVEIDEFIVMPNHVHGIIVLTGNHRDGVQTGQPRGVAPTTDHAGAGPRACPVDQTSTNNGLSQTACPIDSSSKISLIKKSLSLPDVIHRFKTLTTRRYIDGIKQSGWASFEKRLWQRNYYEHIMRNEESLNCIRDYIINNPLKWNSDPENPNI